MIVHWLIAMLSVSCGCGSDSLWAEELSCGASAVYVQLGDGREECIPDITLLRRLDDACEVSSGWFEVFADEPRSVPYVNVGSGGAWFSSDRASISFQLQDFEGYLYSTSADDCLFRIVEPGSVGNDRVRAELASPCRATPLPGPFVPMSDLIVDRLIFSAVIEPHRRSALPPECVHLIEDPTDATSDI